MKRRISSIITALALCLSLCPAWALADEGHSQQDANDEASVTIGTETLYYATLEEAFAAANGQTATITMLNDAECIKSDSNGSPLNINSGTVTLNLNGKTLSGKGNGYYGIINVSGGSLLVQGEEGKVKVTRTGLSCRESGKLTVEGITLKLVGDDIFAASAGVDNEGGTVILNGTQMTGAASDGQIYQHSGTTTVNNVTATGATENWPKSVWYFSEGTLTINGGTFDKIVVNSDNYGGVTSVAELLGEGCAYKHQGGTWATDDEMAGLEISNVTVEKAPFAISPQGDSSWAYGSAHTLAMNASPVNGGTVAYTWKDGDAALGCTADAYTVPADTPVGTYAYTCEASCDGYTLSHTFKFTVTQCLHEGIALRPLEGEDKHSGTCPACGTTVTEDCGFQTFTPISGDAENHLGVCACGREKAFPHGSWKYRPSGRDQTADLVYRHYSRTCTVCSYEEEAGQIICTAASPLRAPYGQTANQTLRVSGDFDKLGVTEIVWMDDTNKPLTESGKLTTDYTLPADLESSEALYRYTALVTAPGMGLSGIDPDIVAFYFQVQVTPVPLPEDKITLAGGPFTYNGKGQEPTVSIEGLTEGKDFTVTYADNVNAGDRARVTVTGSGNYEGTVEKTFSIEKAGLTAPEGTGPATAGGAYGTPVNELAVVNGPLVFTQWGIMEVPGTWTLLSTDTPDAREDPYEYEAVFTPGEGTENFAAPMPTAKVKVTVGKAALLEDQTHTLQLCPGTSGTIDVGKTGQGPLSGFAGWTLDIGSVAGGIFAAAPSVDGTKLSCQAAPGAAPGDKGTVTLTASTRNYENFAITVQVEVVDKFTPELDVSIQHTYNGRPPEIEKYAAAMVNGEAVSGTWSFAGGPPADVKDSGEYGIKFTPDDADRYNEVTQTVRVDILPASVTVTADSKTITLGDPAPAYTCTIAPSGVNLGFEPDLSCAYNNGDGAGTYSITVSGQPRSTDGNYAVAYRDGTLTVKSPALPVDPGQVQMEVKVEKGISQVPDGLKGIPALATPAGLETAMRTAVTQTGVPSGNTAVYDVTLMVSTDGGRTWAPATRENFPADGRLTVTLPYPRGTDKTYTFTVVHMFTTSDFGKVPGATETPAVTNTERGLQFTVTGLSPISVGWKQPSTPVTPSASSGGGSSISTCAVTVEKSEHGKVTSSRASASNGSTVILTATPDGGYVLGSLTVTDSRGSEIRLTAQGGGKYTFTMPSRAVTVKAAFAPLPGNAVKPCDGGADCPSHGFADLGAAGTWYHEAVDYVLRNNLMGGYGNGLFGPDNRLTRAQFAQILYNKEGRPAVTGGSVFADVAPGAWCAPAVAWAAERGIVGGYGSGIFGPDDNITREQLAVMLWRYAGSPAAIDKELHFTDAGKSGGYALDALRWAVENGIINGRGGGILDPKGLATRAQAAQMLKSFLKDE